ncbi:MAG: hypothetical protein ACRYG4_11785, partial [Janthinobacterium lividum]
SWNSGPMWDRIDNLEQTMPIDGGDGTATVELGVSDMAAVTRTMNRTMSDPTSDPVTGVDLGAGAGAGRVTEGDKGGAASTKQAAKTADALAPR